MPGFADAYGINLPAIDQAVAQKRAYDQAFQQQGALQRFGAQAFAPDATDATRAQAISGLAAVDPAKAVQFQEVFMKMNDAQRQHAKDLNNIIGATAYSLKQLPPEQRAARLQSQIPDLVKSGISMDKIQSVDLSDAGLDSLVSQARTLDQQISQANTDRTFQAGRSDHADTMRHQQIQEDLSAAQLADARSQHAFERSKPISVPQGGTLYDPATGKAVIQGAPKQNEDMAKNTQLYTRASQQLPIALQGFDALANTGNQIGASLIGTAATGPEYQRANAAVMDIAASYLYSVSGATANPGEVKNLAETITPKIGDRPQTVADKKARLQQMVDSIKIRAQGGNPQGLTQAPVAAPPSQPRVIDFNSLPD